MATSTQAKTPALGDPAPLIQGKDQDGKEWKLADVVGKRRELGFEFFECLAPMWASLYEDIAVESGFRSQGQACRAVE